MKISVCVSAHVSVIEARLFSHYKRNFITKGQQPGGNVNDGHGRRPSVL